MLTIRRVTATLGLSAALLVSSAGVASAQSWSTTDPTGDVVKATAERDPVGHPETIQSSSTRRVGDVRAVAVSHTTSGVVIKMTMHALPTGNWMGMTTIRTPTRSYDVFHMRFSGRSWVSFTKTRGDGTELPCAVRSSQISGTSVIIRVGRTCLGNPSAVRVAAGVSIYPRSGMQTAYIDDGLRRGFVNFDSMAFSPVIRRG